MNLTDPALLIALAVGVLLVGAYVKLQPRPPQPPQCPNCGTALDLEEEIVDPENPELRYIPGERRGWFRCVQCRYRVRARY